MVSGLAILVSLSTGFNGVSPPPKGTPLAPLLKRPSSPAPVTDAAVPSFLQTIGRGAYLAYRATLSGAKGRTCRFSPSCSLYGHQAIEHYGLLPGLVLFAGRLLRAHVNYGELRYAEIDDFTLLHTLSDSLPFVSPPEHLPWTALFNSR